MTAQSSRRRATPLTFTTWKRGRFTAAVQGPVRVLHAHIRKLDLKWQWDHRAGCYTIPLDRLDDLLVSLELDGHRVQYPQAGLW